MSEQPLSVPRKLGAFALVGFQLVLILLVVDRFRIEKAKLFLPILCLAVGGFVIHAWLPRRWRAAFFVLLSLGSILVVFGWPNGVYILGIGGALIALCLLPLPLIVRVPLLVVAAAQLATLRAQLPLPFWPVLASMFMFRLIVYLYETRRQRERPPLIPTLAYFFPLPNIGFTFFPILDFQTFRATYYDDEDYAIYQSGIVFLVRGLLHLLLYRLVKYYLLPAPHQLTDLPHLLLFLATNYALYLHVSGWFHIITGILHLFGFNLPRTHRNYFLASSVSDVWRRINIYWKDFMAKVFFYPAFFALHRRGTSALAVIVATLGVFLATWLLHSYQVFWLRGELPVTGKDAILWLAAGVMAALTLRLDLRRAEKPSRSPPPQSAHEWLKREGPAAAILTLKILSTFFLVSFFWACWTVPGFIFSLPVRAALGAARGPIVGMIGAGVVGIVAAGVLVQFLHAELHRRGVLPLAFSFPRSAALQTLALLALVAAGTPWTAQTLGPQLAEVMATLRLESTTPVEAAVAVQSYYEEIADVSIQASPLMDLPGLEKKRPVPEYTEMTRPADDFLGRELIPGWQGECAGHPLTINRLGMRDREGIAQEKPAGVCRLAFVGSSVVMGYGVGDDETFTRLLDASLNAELSAGRQGMQSDDDRTRRIEVLNFGTGKSQAIHRLTLITRKVLAFNPDAVYCVAHQDEYLGTVRHLTMLIDRRNELPAYLRQIVQEVGITPQTPPGLVELRLQTFAPRILREVYADIVRQCRRRGILPVWVYLPVPGVKDTALESSELIGLAEEAGFVALNLSKWDAGHTPEAVKVDRHHPNALGHKLLAERLRAALRERPDALPACARP